VFGRSRRCPPLEVIRADSSTKACAASEVGGTPARVSTDGLIENLNEIGERLWTELLFAAYGRWLFKTPSQTTSRLSLRLTPKAILRPSAFTDFSRIVP